MEYDLDSVPVDPKGRATYLERFIHGEIYRVRPDVLAVVHNHSPSVIPFGVTGAQLRPLYHMSAFLWPGVPVFEIRGAGGPAKDPPGPQPPPRPGRAPPPARGPPAPPARPAPLV